MNITPWKERGEWATPFPLNPVETAMQAEIDELRAALKAQPVQEPIALLHDDGYWTRINTPAGRAFADKRPLPATKVYAAPVQPVQPALTDAEDPTADELETFRRTHWMHWNAADNLLISHLVAKLRTGGAG